MRKGIDGNFSDVRKVAGYSICAPSSQHVNAFGHRCGYARTFKNDICSIPSRSLFQDLFDPLFGIRNLFNINGDIGPKLLCKL